MSGIVFSRISTFLRWGAGAIAVALALAGCGGGGGGGTAGVTPVSTASAQPDQVAAFAAAQQAVMAAQAPVLMLAADGNMLSNGSFESGMTDWANWGNASVVAGEASAGSSSLRV